MELLQNIANLLTNPLIATILLLNVAKAIVKRK